jgi:hypothetical protein
MWLSSCSCRTSTQGSGMPFPKLLEPSRNKLAYFRLSMMAKTLSTIVHDLQTRTYFLGHECPGRFWAKRFWPNCSIFNHLQGECALFGCLSSSSTYIGQVWVPEWIPQRHVFESDWIMFSRLKSAWREIGLDRFWVTHLLSTRTNRYIERQK